MWPLVLRYADHHRVTDLRLAKDAVRSHGDVAGTILAAAVR
jgi:hypothetical protein